MKRVRFVAHTSSCLSPWLGGIQATCIWYPARHGQITHLCITTRRIPSKMLIPITCTCHGEQFSRLAYTSIRQLPEGIKCHTPAYASNRNYVKYQSVFSALPCTNLNSLLRISAAFQWKVQSSTSITSNFTQVSVYCVEILT